MIAPPYKQTSVLKTYKPSSRKARHETLENFSEQLVKNNKQSVIRIQKQNSKKEHRQLKSSKRS